MRILLLNPPHPAIGSRIPHEHLPPLGLLSLGGPLLDAGHEVQLLDAEFGPMPLERILEKVCHYAPHAILIGHSGSTSAHPVVCQLTRALRRELPQSWIIYGGVFPTFHWEDILRQEKQIDVIVRGEGERTVVELVGGLEEATPLESIRGIAFRKGTVTGRLRQSESTSVPGRIAATPLAPLIRDLDSCRVGWELIDHTRYTYWGDRRAVVVQFSRGCPHQCSYCGQQGFWRTWRHRDPVKFAAELARLYREEGVEVINFADENPTASRELWQRFLEALVKENVPLILVGSTRASDIVRDADILPLYRQAGVARLLMGIESTDDETLRRIEKGSTQAVDREAIRLLRRYGIVSMAAVVTGFAQETDRDYWRALRQLLSYDPDQIQALYATPHRWTAFADREAGRGVIQADLRRWDYKHQVLESAGIPSWRIMLWMKFIEAAAQLRPKSLWRLLAHPDPMFRAAMRWYYGIGVQVWWYEIRNWFFRDQRSGPRLRLSEFWGTQSPVTFTRSRVSIGAMTESAMCHRE